MVPLLFPSGDGLPRYSHAKGSQLREVDHNSFPARLLRACCVLGRQVGESVTLSSMTGQCWKRQALGNQDLYNVLPIFTWAFNGPGLPDQRYCITSFMLASKCQKFLWSKAREAVPPSSLAGSCCTDSLWRGRLWKFHPNLP